MKNFLILFSCLILCTLSCSAVAFSNKTKITGDSIKVDSLAQTQLGISVTETLMNPGKVSCYILKGKSETDENDFVVEPHYVRDSLVGTLTPEMYSILQFALIADQNNYKTDSVLVKSPYVPQLEFEFARKRITVHVVVSLSDYSWSIIFDGKKQFNWNYANKELIHRYCTMLINNKKED